MTMTRGTGLALLWALTPGAAFPAPGERPAWKAGVGRAAITPGKPVWLTGYAVRTRPSEGAIHDLHVKALALDDGSGRPAVLVSSDILGFPTAVGDRIAAQAQKRWGISRDRLALNSSHTHCGPALAHPHAMLYGPRVTPEQAADIEEYTRFVEAKTVAAIGAALEELRPARLRFGQARATFGANRRVQTPAGGYTISVNPEGPVDHDVPVLAVEGEDGELHAVLFGYACHNTTLGGNVYECCGDYAGFAQQALEQRRPGAAALFVQGCAGDINPSPRGEMEHARQHGEALAAAVEQALAGPMRAVAGPLACAYEQVPLAFATPPDRATLEAQLEHQDIFHQWQARELLKVLDRNGKLPSHYPYPLQVWQFGRDLTFVAMAGEVVVDYSLRLKKELGADALWVAGYSNDVFAYVPSLRILTEGGYEGAGAMVYYVQPGPFTSAVEETVVGKIRELISRVRRE